MADEVKRAEADKARNRRQFGANAANYATSEVHAKGASLARMVEIADPSPEWLALDVATAAGHTAFAFAPHVREVIATDLTPEMVELASQRAGELGIANVGTRIADAESLPFEAERFDLVTCRIAPHHFPAPDRFVAEVARVLRPGGVAVIVDNIVPDDASVARFCNDWEKRRDPSHVRCLSVGEWTELFEANGLEIDVVELVPKRMDFTAWADNMSVPVDTRVELLHDLLNADAAVTAFLQPSGTTTEDAGFVLTEGLFSAPKGTD